MNTFRIEISPRQAVQARQWLGTAHLSGYPALTGCLSTRLFFIQGNITAADADALSAELLCDPVTETYHISAVETPSAPLYPHTIEVTLLPGVTDPVAENLVRAAHLIGISGVSAAATGTRFILEGALSPTELDGLAVGVFSNPVIQRYEINQPIQPPFVAPGVVDMTPEIIPLREADDSGLLDISKARRLALDLNEMRAIQAYYQAEGRDPNDVEIEMLAQTWSEHCVHKTFKADIDFTDATTGQTQQIHGLLKTYIRAATDKLNKDWVRSAFVDNAGIIRFDAQWDIAFKVETHNHPSALEPFGGANTGVGGVVRDVLGVSARPIANTDILCFGYQDTPADSLLDGVLHPRRIQAGVVHGIEDYGNKMGIPTVNGAVYYHPGYTANPLVFCGCLGILPHGSHPTGAQAGDYIVVIGGRTGRDGLRGATFSSMEMDTTTSAIAGSSVQIGHPIQEKQVQEVVLRARDAGLYTAITDCGAGGLSSAVGEMGANIGATVHLERVPLKYPGLRPWEIWLSEAQERMVLAVAPHQWEALQAVAAGQDVEAVVIGTFTPTARLTLYYGETCVGDVSMAFLHDGIPTRQLKAVWGASQAPRPSASAPQTPDYDNFSGLPGQTDSSLADSLLALLAHPNIRSREAIIRRYDHEVQGGTAIKPLVGVDDHGHADAAVLTPLDTLSPATEKARGVALSVGLAPAIGELDPYLMSWYAVDEALRNLVASGADPEQVAILDNFCWGNPNLPDRLGALVRYVQGCHDAALAYGTPFISGKDSLNNEYADAHGERHAIPGTLLISAVGIVPDVHKTATSDLKTPGDSLYLIGQLRTEMGGSHYNLIHSRADSALPPVNPDPLPTLKALHQAMTAGLVSACHDVSDGGLAVALAEMCIGGRLGAHLTLEEILSETTYSGRPHAVLFGEAPGLFVVEVHPDSALAFEDIMRETLCTHIGEVTADSALTVEGAKGQILLSLPVVDLETVWRGVTPEPVGKTPTRDANPQSFTRPANAPATAPKILILHANGSNRDRDAALACQLAGGEAEIVHVNQLVSGERSLLDYHGLFIPGGFSYGDDLGAGQLWAVNLRHLMGDAVRRFVEEGRPVMGVCNGFQVLVKAGLLPGILAGDSAQQRPVTLTYNEAGQFECRWVYMEAHPASVCRMTDGLHDLIHCPVAHGEGRVAVRDAALLERLDSEGLIALTYVNADGSPAAYPANPNGSALNIAGLTNPAGNVLGLMPHPENHVFPWQYPGGSAGSGLRLFENFIRECGA